jgi:transcriptional regulator with XRE-family HTH domain
MKGAANQLTIGERVARYRRRRGLSQVTLAELVGRTESWLEKVENGRAALDRVSVIGELAKALDVSLHDLLPDDVANIDDQTRGKGVPALREMILSYRVVNPRFAAKDRGIRPADAADLHQLVDDVWTAYQDSRFGYVIMRLNQVLPLTYVTAQQASGEAAQNATRCVAYLYQLAASVLVKLGDLDLARLCADRGDLAVQTVGDPIASASLQRSIAHTLLSNAQYDDAVAVVDDGLGEARDLRGPEGLSVQGAFAFVGAVAAARAGDRAEASRFLRRADSLANSLGRDANHVWTAFGPTNVAMHRVTVAAELGDVHQATDLGLALDVTALPRERQVRHHLEVARALSRVARRDEALAEVLTAEHSAPEQVRGHFLTHELVHHWIRDTRRSPSLALVGLSQRLGHVA